jgi:uncharacterized glyoxalase superfamily protein PhnB
MARKVKPVPKGCHTLTPHLVVRDAAAAIKFYKKAFGAKELRRAPGPDRKSILHAELQIGDSRLFLNDEFPDMGAQSPQALKGTPVTIHMWCENVDKAWKQAVKAGAKVAMPLADQFWGDRYGVVTDPFGHSWALASHMKDPSPEEMQVAAAAAFAAMGKH